MKDETYGSTVQRSKPFVFLHPSSFILHPSSFLSEREVKCRFPCRACLPFSGWPMFGQWRTAPSMRESGIGVVQPGLFNNGPGDCRISRRHNALAGDASAGVRTGLGCALETELATPI